MDYIFSEIRLFGSPIQVLEMDERVQTEVRFFACLFGCVFVLFCVLVPITYSLPRGD